MSYSLTEWEIGSFSWGDRNVTTDSDVLLTKEQALAKRWLRGGLRPLPLWQWLSGSQTVVFDPSAACPPELLDSLQAFAKPLGEHSNTHERQTLTKCLDVTAATMLRCSQHANHAARPCIERLLAASLLPMYRGLARGTVNEVCSVLRRQLADCVTLSLLLEELSGDLVELLTGTLPTEQSPYESLGKHLQLDLELLTQTMLSASQKWDGASPQQLRLAVQHAAKPDARPAWGAASVLWRLAGELISDRAEFVVPRDWINVPVPWSEASEHWRKISAALATAPVEKHAPQAVDSHAAIPKSKTADAATTDDDIQRLKLEIEIADAVDSLVQASRHATGRAVGNRTDRSHGPAGPTAPPDEFIVPKVIIAEVRSHNDPAFVAVVRRQLGLCRSEEREMALIAVCVQPDDSNEESVPTLQALGLASWQQKLVNWMSDHPEVHDLYAFVSNEGELILSLMDLERNTTTALLRQGLVEVLSGVVSSSDNAASLSRAPMPARYYSGIGSVSSPSAGFEPEQLIEATYRCLEAAQRQGKAAIKSIEVF